LKSKTTERFRKLFQNLPIEIQKSAKKSYELWIKNPNHPSLHFKKIQNLYSVRIADKWRVLGFTEKDVYVWFWIGSHEEYNKLIP
jgi:plasmid maintenance system killer protein